MDLSVDTEELGDAAARLHALQVQLGGVTDDVERRIEQAVNSVATPALRSELADLLGRVRSADASARQSLAALSGYAESAATTFVTLEDTMTASAEDGVG